MNIAVYSRKKGEILNGYSFCYTQLCELPIDIFMC